MQTYTYVHAYIYNKHTYIQTYNVTCRNIYTYKYIYTCTHTCIYACLHACIETHRYMQNTDIFYT